MIKKVDILAIGVHPDDVELGCSGTLLKHISMGYTAAIVDLTQGELGTRGSAELRIIEANNAAKILGVNYRENLKMADGFFTISKENIMKVITVIRKYQPNIVLANSIDDRHPDHGRAAKLVNNACFYAGLVKIDTNNLPPWRPKALYHYIQDKNISPDFVIDVSEHVDAKFEAIRAFSSQFFIENEEGPRTPISSEQFTNFLKSKMAVFGRSIQADYAEGFNVSRTPGVVDLHGLQ